MSGPLGLVPPLAPPPPRRYLANLADIRRGKADPLTEAINSASNEDPVLAELMDSKQSGIAFVSSLGRFVVLAVGKGTKVHIATAATREDAERLLEAGPGGRP